MNRLPFTYFYFTFVLLFTITLPVSPPASAQSFPGGFIEKANSGAVRDRVTPADIPCPPGATPPCLPERGKFTFPEPYNTEAIRLTNETDCGGTDCVEYVGYSYWRNINNHVGSDTMFIFLGLNQARGGGGPTLFSYNKVTDEVVKVGPLFEATSPFSSASGEGWYFSAAQPTKLYVNLPVTSSLQRYDVVPPHTFETVFDVSAQFGSDKYIWQMHSSDDDKVHSATLRCVSIGCTDGVHTAAREFEMMGCLVYREVQAQFLYFPRTSDDPLTVGVEGAFDECHIDKSGRWLLILENVDGAAGEDNRIIDLDTGVERILLDRDGAAGHADVGYGYMVAADNWDDQAGTWKLWKFADDPLQGTRVYHNLDWSVSAPNHVSHSNARPEVPPEDQYACGSSANRNNSTHANEIICFRLDTSLNVLVVAPVMTDLDAPGGGNDYAKVPKGNLDVTGKYFIWTDNMAGDRLDAFIVKVPDQCLYRTPQHDGPCDTLAESEPTAHWPVDEGSGLTIADITGNGHTGSLVNGPSWVAGRSGQALSFDGVDDHVVVNHAAALNAFPLTVTAWIRTTTTARAGIVNKYAASSLNGYNLFTENGQLCAWYFRDGSNHTWDGSTCTLAVTGANDGQWHHTAFVVDSTQARLYLDGVLRATQPWTGSPGPTTTTQPLNLALYPGAAPTSHLPGTIDDVRVYGRALTEDEIGTLAQSGSVGDVVWTNLVNVTATGNSLQKTSGCNGCQDAGATSSQEITAGDGYVEFTASETTTSRGIGLSNGNTDTTGADIDFAIALWHDGLAYVYENGVYKFDTWPNMYATGDVFRVAVEGGIVKYYWNGALIYTSQQVPTYPLLVDTTLFDLNSTISNAVIAQTP